MTLVETLVVAAIVVLLMALILPAIQKVRASSYRLDCANNLRQLGIAAHTFHGDHGRLPPGYLGPSLAKNVMFPAMYFEGQWVGHLPLLLPYLEEDALFHQIKVDFNLSVVSPAKWFWSAPAQGPGLPNVANYTVAMKQLKVFRCPSATNFAAQIGDPSPTGGGTVLGLHVFNNPSFGPFTVGWKDEYGPANQFRPLGRTNYLGVAGCGSGTDPVYAKFEGIYTNRSNHSLGQLAAQDGTSNTLLYGETCGSFWSGSPPYTYDICWMAAGSLGTYFGLQPGPKASTIVFSSNHAAGVQFCFADGSVRIVRFGETRWDQVSSQSSDWLLLQQLAGIHDGGPADASALVD
jgi:hypothetical protein